jgi:hypothetical protein
MLTITPLMWFRPVSILATKDFYFYLCLSNFLTLSVNDEVYSRSDPHWDPLVFLLPKIFIFIYVFPIF